jgi:general secretion pathway protein G
MVPVHHQGELMFAQVKKMREEEGFTLIELLIVIIILGVLAGIVVFAVNGITDRGNASACKADAKTYQIASEAYYAQNGAYAATAGALVTAGFLRNPLHVDGANGYTITYTPDGKVAASGTACTVAAS